MPRAPWVLRLRCYLQLLRDVCAGYADVFWILSCCGNDWCRCGGNHHCYDAGPGPARIAWLAWRTGRCGACALAKGRWSFLLTWTLLRRLLLCLRWLELLSFEGQVCPCVNRPMTLAVSNDSVQRRELLVPGQSAAREVATPCVTASGGERT